MNLSYKTIRYYYFWKDCCLKPPIILQDLRMNYSMYKL